MFHKLYFKNVIVFPFSFTKNVLCGVSFNIHRFKASMNRKISLLQCNDTHLHGMLKGWKFIVCFRVWQLAILQMGYPHCNINKLYHGDKEHNREKRKPLITHQKAAFCQKPCCSRVQVYLCVQCCYSVWPKIETYVVWYPYCICIYKLYICNCKLGLISLYIIII